MKKKKVFTNVASSVFVLEDYINLENHIFLSMMWIYRCFRCLIPAKYHDFFGRTGLTHHWMYDKESITHKVINAGFNILPTNNTPSESYRKNDKSVHVVAVTK